MKNYIEGIFFLGFGGWGGFWGCEIFWTNLRIFSSIKFCDSLELTRTTVTQLRLLHIGIFAWNYQHWDYSFLNFSASALKCVVSIRKVWHCVEAETTSFFLINFLINCQDFSDFIWKRLQKASEGYFYCF